MFLDTLTDDELLKVEQIGKPRTFMAGNHLIEEGKTGDSFFLVIAGKVEVRKRMGSDRYRSLVKLGPCDVVGEIGFLGVASRTANVVALEETQVLEFSRTEFEQLIEQEASIGLKAYRGLARELADRLARNDQELMEVIAWSLGKTKKLRKSSLGLASGEADSSAG
jgi:CRP-like cAMP-binding protein